MQARTGPKQAPRRAPTVIGDEVKTLGAGVMYGCEESGAQGHVIGIDLRAPAPQQRAPRLEARWKFQRFCAAAPHRRPRVWHGGVRGRIAAVGPGLGNRDRQRESLCPRATLFHPRAVGWGAGWGAALSAPTSAPNTAQHRPTPKARPLRSGRPQAGGPASGSRGARRSAWRAPPAAAGTRGRRLGGGQGAPPG
jgi:hypothetical protein